jgi:hypothetical protein
MSTRTILYALTVAAITLALPAAATARPLYDTGPVVTPTPGHAVSSGPSPLLFVAVALAIIVIVLATHRVRARQIPVKA